MLRLFLYLHQLTLFGTDIASYTNGLTSNGDVNGSRFFSSGMASDDDIPVG